MAASVQECHYDRKTISASSSDNGMGVYKVGYIIRTNSISQNDMMGPQEVVAGAQAITGGDNVQVPQLWDSYAYQGDVDNFSYARDFEISVDQNSQDLWYLTVTYRPPEPGEGSRNHGDSPIRSVSNPVDREPVIWWDREVTTERFTKDINGDPIVNKCRVHYPDELEIEVAHSVLVAEWNVSTLAEVFQLSRTYDGAVNASSWTISGETFPARTALCREMSSGPPATEQGYTFFHMIGRFVFAKDYEASSWDYYMLEIGDFHWTKTGDNFDLDSNGYKTRTSVSGGVLLTDEGLRLGENDPAVHTPWRVRREANFSLLPI